jgi:hypothetical protein
MSTLVKASAIMQEGARTVAEAMPRAALRLRGSVPAVPPSKA